MSVSRQKRMAWETKFNALVPAAQKAAEDLLVAIYEAKQDDLSYAAIARMNGGVHPTVIPAKVAKGEAIKEQRKRGPKSS